ncbi:hypothetical protein [Janthinobacterium sp. LB2P10]|uniref:hypothetical protein n=1 Tax=Janthinobacterium sp. LB2P10 TaxID=3424194 RepID=UPI003F24416D
MDPISRASVPNAIPATPRVGEAAALAPASPVPWSGAPATLAVLPSTQVELSALGQFLSGVALSRRQLLALQGVTDEAMAANARVNVNDDLLALARQLTASLSQLQTSTINASQLATAGDTAGSLAQRYDVLSGDGTMNATAALAQAGLARIGIDLRNGEVNAATLQAAYAADSNATLDALQQGTDVLAQAGAALARQQGALLATNVEADLTLVALPTQQEEVARAAPALAGAAQVQADAGQATAQAQLAQKNAQAQELAAQNAGMAMPPPSAQDPSVAAAIAAYHVNHAALNPGLMHGPMPASDSRLPLVAPVAPVEAVKPVPKI